MTAAEIDEGAWDAAWQAFRSMCRHGYIPDKTDLGVALRAYLGAALPAPASGGAVAWEPIARVMARRRVERTAAIDPKPRGADFIERATEAAVPLYEDDARAIAAAFTSPASDAAEMRERAAREAETSKGYPTDVSERIRALPLTEPGSNP